MDFVFLICTERSGSNFIVSLMNGHKEVSGPPSSHLFRLFGLNCHNYFPSHKDHNWDAFVTDFVDARHNMLSEWDTDISEAEIKSHCPSKSIKEALNYTYEKERRAGERVTIVKENYTYLIVPFLLANWPQSRFIYQVRDPRDVAASWITQAAIPGGIERACENWLEDQTESLKNFRQMQSSGRAVLIRYEDLVANSEQSAEILCRHIGVEYDPIMLKFYKDDRTKRNAKRIDAWRNIGEPVLKNNFGKYKAVLSKDDIRYIELMCGGLMEVFGYKLETDVDRVNLDHTLQELDKLRPVLTRSVPTDLPSADEKKIRSNRLALIERVKSRTPIQ